MKVTLEKKNFKEVQREEIDTPNEKTILSAIAKALAVQFYEDEIKETRHEKEMVQSAS